MFKVLIWAKIHIFIKLLQENCPKSASYLQKYVLFTQKLCILYVSCAFLCILDVSCAIVCILDVRCAIL